MIALVYTTVAPPEAPHVAGLTLPQRALLALQSAGASSVGLTGPAAEAWLAVLASDTRWRTPLTHCRLVPDAPHVVVADTLALDPTAARALLVREGVLFVEGRVAAVHRSRTVDGHPLCDQGEGSLAPPSKIPAGVALFVTDAVSLRAAERALLDALRKPQDGIVSRALNRPLSLAITRLLCRTPLRPNTLSVAILGVGLTGAALAAHGSWGSIALGGVLFQAQSVLDGCDGELARITYQGTRLGEWLDTVGDDLTNYSFFAGLSVGLAHTGVQTFPWIVGSIGLFAGVLSSLIAYRYLARIGSGDLLKYPMGLGDNGAETVSRSVLQRGVIAVRPFFKRDFFVLATMLAAIAGRTASVGMLFCFAVGATVTLGAVLHSEWIRRGVSV